MDAPASIPGAAGQPILDIRAVSKRFGGVEALKGVSLQLHPGDVVALAGDNGAGKSTLTKIISGVYPADGGEIRLDGKPVRFATPEAARRAGIETIYQDLALADNLSIGANIFLGREPMRRVLGILPMLDRKAMAAAAKETMARLDFHVDRLHAPVGRFSGGQRQAVAISRALRWGAEIIIMDEPTAALGVVETAQVLDLIRRLAAEGRTVVLISHAMADVAGLADRVVVLRGGRKVHDRPVAGLDAAALGRLVAA